MFGVDVYIEYEAMDLIASQFCSCGLQSREVKIFRTKIQTAENSRGQLQFQRFLDRIDRTGMGYQFHFFFASVGPRCQKFRKKFRKKFTDHVRFVAFSTASCFHSSQLCNWSHGSKNSSDRLVAWLDAGSWLLAWLLDLPAYHYAVSESEVLVSEFQAAVSELRTDVSNSKTAILKSNPVSQLETAAFDSETPILDSNGHKQGRNNIMP